MIRIGAGGGAAIAPAVLAGLGLGLKWFADHHHDRGVAAERERNRIAIEATNTRLRIVAEESWALTAQLIEMKQDRAALAAELDRMARDAPNADRDGVDADGWLRIREAWD